MAINEYKLGQTVPLSTTFTVGGVLTDPTTISLKVQTPAGVDTTYTYAAAEITKTGTGLYSKEIAGNQSGAWVYRWEGTGTVKAVDEDVFVILQSEF